MVGLGVEAGATMAGTAVIVANVTVGVGWNAVVGGGVVVTMTGVARRTGWTGSAVGVGETAVGPQPTNNQKSGSNNQRLKRRPRSTYPETGI